MKRLIALALALAMSFLFSNNALAAEAPVASAQPGSFSEDVIEVPKGTDYEITDDGEVVIHSCPVAIDEGSTFVVYYQDLPIGYEALSVVEDGDETIVHAQKADKSFYRDLDVSGTIDITPADYEFVPAPNVDYEVLVPRGMSYDNGKLALSTGVGESKSEVYLSNLQLSYSTSDNGIGVSLSGRWGISSSLKYTGGSDDIPLGEIRIAGIGKIGISLSLTKSMEMNANLGGTFKTGVSIGSGGSGQADRSFTVTEKSVEGKGSISAALKMTAGVDVLVASADLYAEVGATTQLTVKATRDPKTDVLTSCQDYRIYLFLNVGAEAKYFSPFTGKSETLASKDVEIFGEDESPIFVVVHFENGHLVNSCTQGMTVTPWKLGGITANFGSTLLTDGRSRTLETSVKLPWDLTVDGDYTIANGTLDLNGKTLTIDGDLIQSGGTLTVGSGTLIVHGSYRMQSQRDGSYYDSSGALNLNSNGKIYIDEDLVVQTTSEKNSLTNGELHIKGDLYQVSAGEGKPNFNTGDSLKVILTKDRVHTISFDDSANNRIGSLTLENGLFVYGGMQVGKMENNGHDVIIHGNLSTTQGIEMNANGLMNEISVINDIVLTGNRSFDSVPLFNDIDVGGYHMTVNGDMISTGNVDLNSGVLTVNGTLYQRNGTMFVDGGKLNVSGDYLIVGAGTVLEPGKTSVVVSEGYLKMVYDSDEVRVGGDFMTKSYYGHGADYLGAGTLYVGGDFTQLHAWSSNNFAPAEGHRTVLDGEGPQAVSFEDGSCGFGTLVAPNSQLAFSKSVGWLALGSDVSAASDGATLGSRDMRLGGWSLALAGDAVLDASLDAQGGSLTVRGSLEHRSGTLFVDGGKLNISGDYLIVGAGTVLEPGKTSVAYSTGRLKMVYDSDEVRVGGDFMTKSYYSHGGDVLGAGTLYVGGDFTQLKGYYSGNFAPAEGHTTVLDGEGPQAVSFEDGSCGFGTLVAPNSQLAFSGSVGWLALGSDVSAASDGATLGSRDMRLGGWSLALAGDAVLDASLDAQGGSLTVSGSLEHRSGTLFVDGGKVGVSGDYRIVGAGTVLEPGKTSVVASSGRLKMVYDSDEVRVGGDFMTKSGYSHGGDVLGAGTLRVGGDFTQLAGYSGNFAPAEGHTTVLDGEGPQAVSFEDSSCGFGTLVAPNSQLAFSKSVGWLALGSDVSAASDGATLGRRDMRLGGWSLALAGDAVLDASLDAQGGSLTVRGSLEHRSGTLFVDGGKVGVSGDYRIVGAGTVLDPGKTSVATSNGCLKMVYDSDEVRVGGDFMTKSYYSHGGDVLGAGTLRVGGDFTQLGGSSYNFAPAEGHTTVLDGDGPQAVSFESDNSHFGTLMIKRPVESYTFSRNPCWIALSTYSEPDFILPLGLKKIEESAFEGTTATIVYVPDGCTSIGKYAFRNSSLTQIRIPALCEIDDTAFDGCVTLRIVSKPGSAVEAFCNRHDNCSFVSE